MVSSFNATALCLGKSSARLAILYETDLLDSYFSSFSLNGYFIDLFKDSTSTNFFHSRFYESNSTWSAGKWDGLYSPDRLCAIYRVRDMKFREELCSRSRPVMCEIVL